METFSALLALCEGNSPVTGEFPSQSQWRGALMFSLICAWINRWVNNREAGDLRRHRAHYDVIVITAHGWLTDVHDVDHYAMKWSVNHIVTRQKLDTQRFYPKRHYTDVTMSPMASQITSLGIVYSTVYWGADQRKHHNSASLAFVWRIHRGPVNSPHKRPVTRKMFSFDDVIMGSSNEVVKMEVHL